MSHSAALTGAPSAASSSATDTDDDIAAVVGGAAAADAMPAPAVSAWSRLLRSRVADDLSNVRIGRIVGRYRGEAGERGEGDGVRYLCTFKGLSYRHARLLSEDEVLVVGGKQGRRRLDDFLRKEPPLLAADAAPAFNEEFVRVDRVLAVTADEALVKWRRLPYAESTWEKLADLRADPEPLQPFMDAFAARQQYETVPRRPVRPPPSAWTELAESPVFRGDNTLRPWQVEGVSWLQFGWYQRRGCILGDEMGLGKTVQAIALLVHIADVYASGPFLVVAPLSTISHWKRELEAWSDLNTVVLSGSREDREMCKEYEWHYWTEAGVPMRDRLKFDVLVCTYETVMAEAAVLSQIDWRCMVVDEGHRLKNHESKLFRMMNSFSTEHRVLLTGTPVQNQIAELWTLLHFVAPESFASREQFLAKYGSMQSSGELENLQEQLSRFLLRRLKEDVATFLPPKMETIVEIELTQVQKQYYRAVLERNREFLNKGCETSAPKLINIGMQLRKVCNHPFLIAGAEQRILAGLADPNDLAGAAVNSSGKLVFVDKLLPRLIASGTKTLIFSQFKMMLDVLATYLRGRGYAFERIDGDLRGPERQLAIDRFSSDDSAARVFLLSTRAGGLGLNLQVATTVIIFDSDWNPQADVQAQARAHRLGQKQHVTVYRLITSRTYEQHMFEVASRKLGLDQALLHGAALSDASAASTAAGSGGGGSSSGGGGSSSTWTRKQEIDRLLRRGTYDVFTADADEASRRFCDDDIDTILEQRTKTWTCGAGGSGGGFSKARFTSAQADASVALDAPDFWDKVLPDRSTPTHLLRELAAGDVAVDFMERLAAIMDGAAALPHDGDQRLAVLELLAKVAAADASAAPAAALSDADRERARAWLDELENPRKRRRRKSAIEAEQRREFGGDDGVDAGGSGGAGDAGDAAGAAAGAESDATEMTTMTTTTTAAAVPTSAAAAAAAAEYTPETDAAALSAADAAAAAAAAVSSSSRRRRASKKAAAAAAAAAATRNKFGSAMCSRAELRVLRQAALQVITSWRALTDADWDAFAAQLAPMLRCNRGAAELSAFTLVFLDMCASLAPGERDRAAFGERRRALLRHALPGGADAVSAWFPVLAAEERALRVHITCHVKRWARLCLLGKEVATCLARYDAARAPLVIPATGRHQTQQAAAWWAADHDAALLQGVRTHGLVQASLDAMYADVALPFTTRPRAQLPHLRAVELRVRALVVELGRSASHPMIDDAAAAAAAAAASAPVSPASPAASPAAASAVASPGAVPAAAAAAAAAIPAVAAASVVVAPGAHEELETSTVWSKRDKVFFQRALLVYGPGRWALFREKAGLQSKTLRQLQHFFEELLRAAHAKLGPLQDVEARARTAYRHTYCVCRAPAGASSMILCAACTDWFHRRCVGVAAGAGHHDAAWSCPRCRAAPRSAPPTLMSAAAAAAAASKAASGSAAAAASDPTRPKVAHPMAPLEKAAVSALLRRVCALPASGVLLAARDADQPCGFRDAVKCALHLRAVVDALDADAYGRAFEVLEDVRLVLRNWRQFHAARRRARQSPEGDDEGAADVGDDVLAACAAIDEQLERMEAELDAELAAAAAAETEAAAAAAAQAAAAKRAQPSLSAEISTKMAVKVVERVRAFDEAKQCMEMSAEARVAALRTASSRWMPSWWTPTKHDRMLVESALTLGFGMCPPGFLDAGADASARKFVEEFFGDRGPLIRRFRYATYWMLHQVDPNSRAARVRFEQGLLPVRAAPPKGRKPRTKAAAAAAAAANDTMKTTTTTAAAPMGGKLEARSGGVSVHDRHEVADVEGDGDDVEDDVEDDGDVAMAPSDVGGGECLASAEGSELRRKADERALDGESPIKRSKTITTAAAAAMTL